MSTPRCSSAPGLVLITGGARRIGRSIALGMAEAGWDVAVHYHHAAEEARATVAQLLSLGVRAEAFAADLSDPVAVDALLPRVQAALGPVRCLVNNAALFEEDRAASFDPTLLDRHMRTNVSAPLLLARALYHATGDQERACVINLLDQKLFNLNPDYLSYTLSKAALQCATHTLAQAFAPRLRVLGLAPGISLPSGPQSEAAFQQAHQHTPLGRSSTPEDLAQAVCYLARAEAVTGCTLLVDGGQHLLPLARDIMFLTS